MLKNPITARIRFRGFATTRFGVIATLLGLAASQPDSQGQSGGPDAVASVTAPIDVWGCVGGTQAYSARGGVCNLGNAPLPGNILVNHPMWTSNLYRLVSNSNTNRFEQIGMSWVKHDDWASDAFACTACGAGTCNYCTVPPCPPALDPGCSDVYNCQNGVQDYGGGFALGPRSQINAATGAWPPQGVSAIYCSDPASVIACRLQVSKSDVGSSYPGAQYFLEQQVITLDDAAAGNGNNNVSYKPATIGACETSGCDVNQSTCGEARSCTGCDNCVYTLTVGSGQCQTYSDCNDGESCTNDTCTNNVCQHTCTSSCSGCCQEPAIHAWQESDSGVVETEFQAKDEEENPVDGKFILAAKAWNVGGSVWEYEYALYNMNSDRAADEFSVPLPTDLCAEELSDIDASAGFHGISYHSGEEIGGDPIDDTDWGWTVTSGSITWATAAHSPAANANALRWGTLYNFRFQAPRVPNNPNTDPIDVTIDLFKEGSPSCVEGASIAPVPATTSHRACCYGEGSCTVTTECLCDELSGVFVSTSTNCALSPCAMRPGP